MATSRSLRPSQKSGFHADRTLSDQALSVKDRERIIQPYLPPVLDYTREEKQHTTRLFSRRPHLRAFLAELLYLLTFHIVQLVFTVYIHCRWTYHTFSSYAYSILYYHHRSPELIQRDVRNVSRLPSHLSIIVDLQSEDANEPAEGLEKLIADVAELTAWCACAGIKMLSIYERTGALKMHMGALNHMCRTTMMSYYPPENAVTVSIRAPQQQFSPAESRSPSPNQPAYRNGNVKKSAGLDLLLLSEGDGRETLVDLTKTLAEMAQKSKLSPSDITANLINAEVTESSFAEPDLLVVMAPSPTSSLIPRRKKKRRESRSAREIANGGIGALGDTKDEEVVALNGGGGEICLRGYPPWQVRLTEIFHVRDGRGIEYQTFLKALHRFAKAEMRFGK